MRKNVFVILKIFLTFFLIMVVAGLGYLLGVNRNKQQSAPKKEIESVKLLDQRPPKYKLASLCPEKNCPAELNLDFEGDGHKEVVRIYDELISPDSLSNFGCPMLPIIIKIFFGETPDLKEGFVYKYSEDNLFLTVKVVKSFWPDNQEVVLTETASSGCGSGHSAELNFIKSENFNGNYYYQVISGPIIGEIDSYQIRDLEKEILVARALWGQDEAHFDPHRYQIEKYTWDFLEKKFIKTNLGATKNKYSVSIEEIFKAEPEVLKFN